MRRRFSQKWEIGLIVTKPQVFIPIMHIRAQVFSNSFITISEMDLVHVTINPLPGTFEEMGPKRFYIFGIHVNHAYHFLYHIFKKFLQQIPAWCLIKGISKTTMSRTCKMIRNHLRVLNERIVHQSYITANSFLECLH